MRVVYLKDLPESIREKLYAVQADEPGNPRNDQLPLYTAIAYLTVWHRTHVDPLPTMVEELIQIVESARMDPYFDEESLVKVMGTFGSSFDRALSSLWMMASEKEKQVLRRHFNERLEMYRPYAIAGKSGPR